MPAITHLFENNRRWAADITAREPDFFSTLARQQSPEYLWIGCSDSRVPANQIVGLLPGQVFVHRNVANVVAHTDLNCLSTLQFSIDVLRVKHVLVVGHYGCGGVEAALHSRRLGLVDNWLRYVQDVRQKHANYLESIPEEKRADRLCELNVIEQVANVCQTTIVQDAWERGQKVSIHGWVYRLENGLINDLKTRVDGPECLLPAYKNAIAGAV